MLSRLSFLSLLLLAGCDALGSQQGYQPVQPIAFSHAVHAGENDINCLYCHSGAETSRHAGVPPANVCMNCHSQVKKDSPEVQKIYQAIATNTPIEWVKVHRLPDFAYFNHAAHVRAGVRCQQCHGPVETMVRVEQFETMSMGFCVACHRTGPDPANPPPPGKLAASTDCATCHH